MLALGLSLGATVCAALFARLVLWDALPYPQSDRLVIAELQWPGDDDGRQSTYPALDLLQREAQAALAVSVQLDHARDLLLSHPAEPLLNVTYASSGYAELFAPPMVLGRFPGAQSESSAGAAVISHAAWTSLFDQRADVIGLNIRTAGGQFEIVGVTAAGFIEPELHAPGHRTALWLPWAANPSPPLWGWTARTDRLRLVGRQRPDLEVAAATERLSTVFNRAWKGALGLELDAPSELVPRVRLVEARRALADSALALAPLLLAATLGLMLITVANLAHVVVARVVERGHAFSIERALGARSRHLWLAVFVDTLALLLPSSLLAAGVAWMGTAAMRTQLAHLLPRLGELRIGAPGLLLSLGCAVLIALLLASLAYVVCLRESRIGPGVPRSALGGRAVAGRLRTVLMGFQVGLAGLLIAVSLGLFRETVELLGKPGIDLDRSVSLYLYERPGSRAGDAPAALSLEEVKRRLQGLANVELVSQSHSPLQAFIRSAVVSSRSPALRAVGVKRIDDSYLALTRQSLAMGRGFSPEDIQQSAAVALVNAALARVLAVDGEVLGTQLSREGGVAHTVIGVVEDRNYPGARLAEPHLYLPASPAGSNFVLRFRPGQAMSREQWVAQIEAVNPGLGVFLYDDLNAQRAGMLLPQRVAAGGTALIALLVILSAAIGLHGLLAHAALQMQLEVGTRLAFGARARHVLLTLANRYRTGFVSGALAGAFAALLLAPLVAASHSMEAAWTPLDAAMALAILMALAAVLCHLSARRLLAQTPAELLREGGR